MIQVAVYGKGGIGKSTTSSNLSYALSLKGKKIMQIGCDPKRDSTKYLLGGKGQTAVLDYAKSVPPSKRKIADVMSLGKNGIMCIEAGGPEPGIGCAGRGILTAFDVLGSLGVDEIERDVVIYDVLGDVVCGGFAVPMRLEYADAVYIVTSGEFMSIYAANNIMRGLLNFDKEKPRIAGIIFNRRGMEDEEDMVRRFSEATGVPVVCDIPRSPEYMKAEIMGGTVSELFPDSVPGTRYSELADHLLSVMDGGARLYPPRPLDGDQLEKLARGEKVSRGDGVVLPSRCGSLRDEMSSCASRGAAYKAGGITDLQIIIHGPASCGYFMSHTQDNHYLTEVATNPSIVRKVRNNVVCTNMRESDYIFGGRDNLVGTLERCRALGKRKIMVITTCVSGMIGDDSERVVRDYCDEHPGMDVDVIHADGNLAGDSDVGRVQVIGKFMDLIDEEVEPSDTGRVNLFDDTFVWFNRGENERWLDALLGHFGLRIGTKLFDGRTSDEIKVCKENALTLSAEDTKINSMMSDSLRAKGLDVFEMAAPQGYSQTLLWLEALGAKLGKGRESVAAADAVRSEYAAVLKEVGGELSGKRAVLIVTGLANVDWAIEALSDAGAEVVRVYVSQAGGDFHSRFADACDFRYGVRGGDIRKQVAETDPDIVIGRVNLIRGLDAKAYPFPQECVSHKASIKFLRRVRNVLIADREEGWRSWGPKR